MAKRSNNRLLETLMMAAASAADSKGGDKIVPILKEGRKIARKNAAKAGKEAAKLRKQAVKAARKTAKSAQETARSAQESARSTTKTATAKAVALRPGHEKKKGSRVKKLLLAVALAGAAGFAWTKFRSSSTDSPWQASYQPEPAPAPRPTSLRTEAAPAPAPAEAAPVEPVDETPVETPAVEAAPADSDDPFADGSAMPGPSTPASAFAGWASAVAAENSADNEASPAPGSFGRIQDDYAEEEAHAEMEDARRSRITAVEAQVTSIASFASSYGEGSALPLEGGVSPGPEYTVKGNAGSKVFHAADSPWFERTIADVWFTDEDAASNAGFRHWKKKTSD